MSEKDRDGLTYPQATVVRQMIGRVIRRRCICETLGHKCFRCREIEEIRKHFPDCWTWAADVNAIMGPLK